MTGDLTSGSVLYLHIFNGWINHSDHNAFDDLGVDLRNILKYTLYSNQILTTIKVLKQPKGTSL